MMSKYSEAGKGSTNKLKQKKKYDENYDKIFKKLDGSINYDSDDSSDSWDEDRMDIIGINGNTGEHYIK